MFLILYLNMRQANTRHLILNFQSGNISFYYTNLIMSDQIIGENHENISSTGRQKTILLDDTMLVRGGQRVYECTYGGGAPSRGCEVYVTRIPRDCFEAELLPVFSRVGPIFEHRLMMEQNGLNRGYAYVKFTSVQVINKSLGCLLRNNQV